MMSLFVLFVYIYNTLSITYITVDDIKNEISFDDPIDNRNGKKKVGLIRAYSVFIFYDIGNDEKIHLKNGETPNVEGAVML